MMIHSSVMSSPSSVTVRLEPPNGGSAGTGDGGGDAAGGGGDAAGGGEKKPGSSLVDVSVSVLAPPPAAAHGSHVAPVELGMSGIAQPSRLAVAAARAAGVGAPYRIVSTSISTARLLGSTARSQSAYVCW